MNEDKFTTTVAGIRERDARYHRDAFFFLREALTFTSKMFEKPEKGPGRHVSSKELQDGLRQFAINEYGPLAKKVLNSWGIHSTEDFGEIVFLLVDSGVLGKTSDDSKTHFTEGYDFEEAFVKPFLPKTPPTPRKRTPPRRGTSE